MDLKLIATYLQIPSFALRRVEEWKYVYFVTIEGRRPTFVSKRLLKRFGEIRVLAQEGQDAMIQDARSKRVFVLRRAGLEVYFKEVTREAAREWARYHTACPDFSLTSHEWRGAILNTSKIEVFGSFARPKSLRAMMALAAAHAACC